MNVQVPITLHNKFELEVIDVRTNKTIRRGIAHNVILDQYFTRLLNTDSPANLNSISFGTGTGAISAARTAMFAYTGNKTASTVETIRTIEASSITKSIVMEPEEYIGLIFTEVGFSSGTVLTTHALIKDSEGNSISIEKTDYNRIVINATFYVALPQFILGSPALWIRPQVNILLTQLLAGHGRTPIARSIQFTGMKGYKNQLNYLTSAPFRYGSISTTRASVDLVAKEVISTTARASVSSCNGPINLLYWTDLFALELPNPNVWSGMDITGATLGTGNGIETDYDFPVPEISENSEKIYVNGILKIKGTDYDVQYKSLNRIDSCYNMLYDLPGTNPNRPELGPQYAIQQGSSGAPLSTDTRTVPVPWVDENDVSTLIPWEEYEIMVDAGEGILPHSIYIKGYNTGGGYCNPKLFGSNDGTTWTLIFGSSVSGEITLLYSDYSSVPYRYWKFGGYSNSGNYSRIFGFVRCYLLDGKKMLRFKNPIAVDDIVTADFRTPLIPKTENFVLDINWKLKFDRGL